MDPGISVIICCYNSGNKIIPTLEHLAIQQVPSSIPWEILLVDNNCIDDTVTIAINTWDRLKKENLPELRVVKEDKAGLSHARQAGIYHASYNISVFCDDDNWLQKDYLYGAFDIMSRDQAIGVLGGQGEAVADIPIPDWFYPIQENFACGEPAAQSGDITEKKWLWGAGMVLRTPLMRSLYESGFYHMNTDRLGESLSSGGDSEICFWHILIGKKLWYDPALKFKHFISSNRLTRVVAERIIAEHEVSFNALHPYFPLIYPNPHQNENKFILFAKAISSILSGQEGRFLFVKLQPFFNWRLNEHTRNIIRSIETYHVNNWK